VVKSSCRWPGATRAPPRCRRGRRPGFAVRATAGATTSATASATTSAASTPPSPSRAPLPHDASSEPPWLRSDASSEPRRLLPADFILTPARSRRGCGPTPARSRAGCYRPTPPDAALAATGRLHLDAASARAGRKLAATPGCCRMPARRRLGSRRMPAWSRPRLLPDASSALPRLAPDASSGPPWLQLDSTSAPSRVPHRR